MSAKVLYLQCELTRRVADGLNRMVSWIPERFAIAGKYLELKNNDIWENGWFVENVAPGPLPESALLKHRRWDNNI